MLTRHGLFNGGAGQHAAVDQIVADASVTLRADAPAAVAVLLPFERPSIPDDAVERDVRDHGELPAAAAGLLGGEGTASVRFAPPPRVVAVPGAEPVLDEWIRAAEAEYGIPLRSQATVPAW